MGGTTVTDPRRIVLEARGVSFGWSQGSTVFSEVGFDVARGEILGIVGPNGAGKSTLLAILAGLLSSRSGAVVLGGRDLGTLSRRERARRIGYLPQIAAPDQAHTVRELVALGRYPHARGLGFESERDAEAIARAMTLTRVDHLAERPFDEISGGERQRVLVASVLAGEPEVLLLDEPTAALDIGQGTAVLHTLGELARLGAAVVLVTHDLNLAAAFADALLLLAGGKLAACGRPEEVITADRLEAAYGGGFALVERPGFAVPAVLPAALPRHR